MLAPLRAELAWAAWKYPRIQRLVAPARGKGKGGHSRVPSVASSAGDEKVRSHSVFAPTRGLIYRDRFDNTSDVTSFAGALEKGCSATGKSGFMTRDIALLIRPSSG
jgi:hypothetical protein